MITLKQFLQLLEEKSKSPEKMKQNLDRICKKFPECDDIMKAMVEAWKKSGNVYMDHSMLSKKSKVPLLTFAKVINEMEKNRVLEKKKTDLYFSMDYLKLYRDLT